MMDARQRYLDFVMPIVKEGRGQIATEDRTFLDQQRTALNLSPRQAEAIEQRVLKAYQTFLQRRSGSSAQPSQSGASSWQEDEWNDVTPQSGWQEQWQRVVPQESWQEHEGQEEWQADQFRDVEEAEQAKCRWYEEEFRKALETNRLQDPETQERLADLQNDLRLSASDIIRIERQVYTTRSGSEPAIDAVPPPGSTDPTDPNATRVVHYTSPDLTSGQPSSPPSEELADTEVQSPRSHLSTPENLASSETYTALQQALTQQDWRAADRLTFELLLSLNRPDGWFDIPAIENLPCLELERLDRLWSEASKGKFGFTRQLSLYFSPRPEKQQFIRLYGDRYERALAFSKSVGWWRSGAEFYKYYNQLPFDAQTQPGQFPALWFWRIPWWKALQFGGFGSSRGGCRVDPETLDAWMNKIQSCQTQKKNRAESQPDRNRDSTTQSRFNLSAETTVSEPKQIDRRTELSSAETILPEESDF
ncbi:GUN4 domain-containing protein [Egbenema bharatensis]|uniref:GUN4 domain-containing protein n=1 Tax=Egbenema bharatensis TaxID=3463334 RepID=UPI003A84C877